MFILYAFSLIVNSLMTICVSLPSVYPDEIAVAGIAAAYTGRSWSGLMSQIGAGTGYIQALLYAPLFMIFSNPYAIYKAMLIVNAAVISFIPLIVYHLAAKLGVMRVRYKVLTALMCGMYSAYLANSKFIWNEPIACLMSWILVWCLFVAWDRKSRSTRATMSFVIGFLCAVSYGADTRLIAVVAALVLTVVFARILLKEKILNFPIFLISALLSFTAEHLLHQVICGALFGTESENVYRITFDGNNFFAVFFGKIYAFMTSTVGMGAIAVALFAEMMLVLCREGVKLRENTLEDGTKVYEPVNHKYSIRLAVFGLFQFLAVGLVTLFSSLFAFDGGSYAEEGAIFAGCIDNTAPFALFFVFVFFILYEYNLRQLFLGAGVYGYVCLCFKLVSYPHFAGAEFNSSLPLAGLMPLKIGEDIESGFSGMSYVIMSSCVFSVIALLIVFASCSRKHRKSMASGALLCLLAYTTAHISFVYLPKIGSNSSEKTEPYVKVCKFLYNDGQSPQIVVYECEPELAATVQFINNETKVVMLESGKPVPDTCLLIAANGVEAPFDGGSYDVVGRTEEYTVYAYGETARDFIRYNSSV